MILIFETLFVLVYITPTLDFGLVIVKYRVKALQICVFIASSYLQLLMLSGIGPRGELERLGIKCKANLPVGKNLQVKFVLRQSFYASNI